MCLRRNRARSTDLSQASLRPLLVLLLGMCGCNLLTPLAFVGDYKKSVSPEYDKLAHKRVTILVWTSPATLFDYPYARFELASYVGEKLKTEMAQRNLAIDLVDPRDVEDHLQRELRAQADPVAVGREFDADCVLYLEVFEFQMRDVRQPQLLQGRISASTTLYDLQAAGAEPARYDLTPVDCVHPEGTPAVMGPTNAPLIREQAYRKFAEQVARKFYEHSVDL